MRFWQFQTILRPASEDPRLITPKEPSKLDGGADIITQGAAAGAFAKVLVELVKMTSLVSNRNALPILAFVSSEVCAFLLAATGADFVFNRQSISLTILVGIGATAGAIAATALQTKADRVDERINVALTMQPGKTQKDVDKEISASDASK